MSNKFLVVLTGFCLFFLSAQANKETLKQGWDAFNKNDRKQAIELFTKAAQDADTKAEANLGLSFVWWSEDKTDNAFKAFSDFFAASDNPYPYIYALWDATPLEFYGREKDDRLKFLKGLIDDSKANGTLKAMAHEAMGKHYQSVNNFKKAQDEFNAIGSVDNWSIVGTFDNTSGSGFNKDFGGLEHPKSDAVFKNKVNADVTWFTPPYSRSDKWFDFNYYFTIDNSILYAQTFLKSDADREVYFRAGNSGSLKIWVNDKLVTNISEERNCDLDIYANTVKLNKGYNRVLIQIGESETDNANFLLRITDKDGNPLTGFTSTTTYQDYTKAGDYEVKTVPVFAEEYFENKIKTEPTLLNYLMLAETYLRNDKVYEARKALKKARELAPESSFLGTRLIEAYARDKNVTDLTKEYEKIKTNDPDCPYAIKGLINEADEREDYDEVEKQLDKYKEIYGADMYTDMKDLSLAANRKKYDLVISLAQSLYAKYPDSYDLMALNYSIEKNSSKNMQKLNQILKAYLKDHYNDDALTTLASNYFDMGDKSEVYKIYNQRIQNYPYSIGYYTDMSDIYFGAQDYNNALVWAKKALEFAPYIGGYWSRLGKIYMAQNDESNAKDAYRKAIYYTPTNYDARKQLRKLEGKKDLFENFEKADAFALYKSAPKAEDFPDDNSIVLLNETQRVVYPEGATEEHSEILVKVFNQAGIDTWKEYVIGYNQYRQRLIIDKPEIFKKDGNKVQAEKNDDDIVFTNLEAGDAIHLSYRVENYNSGKLAQHFWEQFNFNFDYPVKASKYSLLIPADKKFNFQMLNSSAKPEIKDVEDGMKLYVWEIKDQPSIKVEPHMSPLSDVGIILDISTIPDWKYVSNWYSDLSTTKAKTDFVIKETVADLFKDKQKLTELQKAKIIYDYIEQNVSYSNVPFMHGPIIPQKASRTLNTKLGDCKDVSTLFVAMCKEAGIKANLILVDTRDNGEHHLNLPSIDFDHCIAQLQADGKKYFIELTDQKLSFGSLPFIDLNSNALFIPRDGDSAATALFKLNTTNRPGNYIYRETDLKFDNNDMIFTRKTTKIGYLAAGVRSDFADVGKEKQEKAMTSAVAGDFTNPTKLLNLEFSDLKVLSDSVKYNYSFQIKNELNEVVGIKIFRIPWSEGVRSLDFLSLETRKYPYLVWVMMGAEIGRETINIEIPKGTALAEQPKSVNLTSDFADYSLTYTTSAGKLKAVREIKFKKDVVSPEEYPKFRDFYNKVAEADSKQIGFKSVQ